MRGTLPETIEAEISALEREASFYEATGKRDRLEQVKAELARKKKQHAAALEVYASEPAPAVEEHAVAEAPEMTTPRRARKA